MKRNKLIYTIMFVCTLVATSCSNEEDINLPVTKGNIRFNFSDSGVHNTVSTKAATDKEYQTTFEEGDKIGLYVLQMRKPLHRLKVTTMYALPTKMENGY